MKLLQGDTAASWADVDASWRLGQLVARSATSGEYARALQLWQAARIGTADLAASPATSPPLLSAMQAGLGAKLGFAPATETWMFHRLAALQAVGTPRITKPKADGQAAGLMARAGTAARLEAINQQFDAVDVAMQAPDPKQRIAQIEKVGSVAGQTGMGQALVEDEIEAVSSVRLASIAIALARRQRDGGKLPASLAELGNISKDPGSGADFNYAPGGSHFRLYGVGADGHDDGGDPGKDVVLTAQEPPRLTALN